MGKEHFPGAAFVATAESPLSGHGWQPAHHLPREQHPHQEVALGHQAFWQGKA